MLIRVQRGIHDELFPFQMHCPPAHVFLSPVHTLNAYSPGLICEFMLMHTWVVVLCTKSKEEASLGRNQRESRE